LWDQDCHHRHIPIDQSSTLKHPGVDADPKLTSWGWVNIQSAPTGYLHDLTLLLIASIKPLFLTVELLKKKAVIIFLLTV
jgi:hypothetical protein